MTIGQAFDEGQKLLHAVMLLLPGYGQDARHGSPARHDGKAFAFRHLAQQP